MTFVAEELWLLVPGALVGSAEAATPNVDGSAKFVGDDRAALASARSRARLCCLVSFIADPCRRKDRTTRQDRVEVIPP
ncbi:hypothetical protein GCM10028864_26120 [Microlunatus parietis]